MRRVDYAIMRSWRFTTSNIMRWPDHLAVWAVTLWVGGMWAFGIAASVLFNALPDQRMLAGELAGRLFAVIAWMGMGAAGYLILHRFWRNGAMALRHPVFWLSLVMLLLTLAQHFGIQPILTQLKADAMPKDVMESLFRDRFSAWHGVSSVVYLIEALLGLALVSKLR